MSQFYKSRLCEYGFTLQLRGPEELVLSEHGVMKEFKILHLTNGYSHARPQMWAHIEEITIGRGKPEWGAPDHDVFISRIGAVFHTKNLKAK